MRSSIALLALPMFALAGCTATDGHYPSLLPRPIELQSTAEPERPVVVATPDAALDARIATLSANVDKAASEFPAAAQDAEAKVAVARGLPEGSEPWLNAHTALATLEAKRAPVLSALADLERIAIERGASGLPPYPALDAAVARAEKVADDQGTRLAGLDAALKS